MVSTLMEQFKNLYGDSISKDECDVTRYPDKMDVLWDALKDIDYLLKAIG